jgi:hypothetical protein
LPLFSNDIFQILTDRISKVEQDTTDLYQSFPIYPTTPSIPATQTDADPVFFSILVSTNDPDLTITGLPAAASSDTGLQSSTLLDSTLSPLPTWINTTVTTVPDQTQTPAVPWTSLSAYLANRAFRASSDFAGLFNRIIKTSSQQITASNIFSNNIQLGLFTESGSTPGTFTSGSSVNTSASGQMRFAAYSTTSISTNLTLQVTVQDGTGGSNLVETVIIPATGGIVTIGNAQFIGREGPSNSATGDPNVPLGTGIPAGSTTITFPTSPTPPSIGPQPAIANFRVGQKLMLEGLDSSYNYQQEILCISQITSTGGNTTLILVSPTRNSYKSYVSVYRLFTSVVSVSSSTNGTGSLTFTTVGDRNPTTTKLTIIGGNNQTQSTNTILSTPLQVSVTDVLGSPIAKQEVVWTAVNPGTNPNGPAVSTTNSLGTPPTLPYMAPAIITHTDDTGIATIYAQLGTSSGSYQYIASIKNLTSVTFTETAS